MEKHVVEVYDVVIGQGRPKIMASIVGKTREEILDQAQMMLSCSVDIIEWRLDWFSQGSDPSLCSALSKEIRDVIGNIPLLLTFRTKAEGGEKALGEHEYEVLCSGLIKQSCADLVDLELFKGDDLFERLTKKAHLAGMRVVGSSHDFEKTPRKEEIISRLCTMQDLGADILKIAVMPQSRSDVLTLMDATREMYEIYAKQPLITMAMGSLGMTTRLMGEAYGSAATFGAAAAVSAPGQISVRDLKTVLEIVHKGL